MLHVKFEIGLKKMQQQATGENIKFVVGNNFQTKMTIA
jgi:hypothetical protein